MLEGRSLTTASRRPSLGSPESRGRRAVAVETQVPVWLLLPGRPACGDRCRAAIDRVGPAQRRAPALLRTMAGGHSLP